ncbi:MAG: hypothetical protein ABSH52_20270, partial [Terriglobia bacterium]
APCDKSWGFGGKAPNSSDSPLIPPPFTISHALFIELLTEPSVDRQQVLPLPAVPILRAVARGEGRKLSLFDVLTPLA